MDEYLVVVRQLDERGRPDQIMVAQTAADYDAALVVVNDWQESADAAATILRWDDEVGYYAARWWRDR